MAEEPWRSLTPEERLDLLPELVLRLLDVAICDPSDVTGHREAVWAAVRHGEARRRQGVDHDHVFQEYFLLRETVWHFLRQRGSTEERTEAILGIDAVISLATTASLRGYHRAELEARGGWAEAVEALIEASPLLAEARRRH